METEENSIIHQIEINADSATPKYLQVKEAIVRAVHQDRIKPNTLLPSINEMSYCLKISRDTVERGYKRLKEIGMLGSIPGKGFYIKADNGHPNLRIFLLFNELNDQTKKVYDALAEALQGMAFIELYSYNNSYPLFEDLIRRRRDDYTHYVIIPPLAAEEDTLQACIQTLPQEKVILIGNRQPSLKANHAVVNEDLEKNIYEALEKELSRVLKYKTIKVLVPADHYPEDLVNGINRFATFYGLTCETTQTIDRQSIHAGDLFIQIVENDLVTLIGEIQARGLLIGKQVGIISCTENVYKKLLLDGITTVSTDFHFLGKEAARLITQKIHDRIDTPFSMQVRNSL